MVYLLIVCLVVELPADASCIFLVFLLVLVYYIECSPSVFLGFAPLQAVEAKLSLDALLQMTGAQVRDTMRRLGSSSEECARLSAALSCLKSATESGTFTP